METLTVNQSTKTTEFSERLTSIMIQTAGQFEENVKRHQIDKALAHKNNPEKWLKMESNEQKFVFIMNNKYWLHQYTCYLLSVLTDEIYKNKDEAIIK